MRPLLGYPNARSVAYAVKRALETEGRHDLSARPWNMYAPDTTFWWLVPATDWPAYKHGKLFFSPDRAPEGSLFCGLHIEKGLDPRVSAAYPSAKGKHYIMGKDWIWLTFLEGLDSEELVSALQLLTDTTGMAPVVRLEAGFVEDPGSFDPQATRPKWDKIIFRASGASLLVESADTPMGLLPGVAQCSGLNDLKAAITKIPNADWVWLDGFLGIVIAKGAHDSESPTWNGAQLWKKALSVWESWVK